MKWQDRSRWKKHKNTAKNNENGTWRHLAAFQARLDAPLGRCFNNRPSPALALSLLGLGHIHIHIHRICSYAFTNSRIWSKSTGEKTGVLRGAPSKKTCLMCLKQCHKPSPSHHHFLMWYKPSKMAMLVLPTLISFGIVDDHPWNSWRST